MDNLSKELRSEGFKPLSEGLPPTGEQVFVLTPGYRCIAVLLEDGKWCHVSSMRPLAEEVIAWAPINPPEDRPRS